MDALWSGVLCSLSALPPKADIANHDRHVRFGPLADIIETTRTSSRLDVYHQAGSRNFAVGDVVINVFASQPLAGFI
jgi:hypothetical protein